VLLVNFPAAGVGLHVDRTAHVSCSYCVQIFEALVPILPGETKLKSLYAQLSDQQSSDLSCDCFFHLQPLSSDYCQLSSLIQNSCLCRRIVYVELLLRWDFVVNILSLPSVL